jgi:hypothetical protein
LIRFVEAGAAAVVALALSGCGGSGRASAGHTPPAPSPLRTADAVERCLAARHLHVLRSAPPGRSILYDPSVGRVTVLRVPRYAASVWIYPTAADAVRFFWASATFLGVLQDANALAIFVGRSQPTPRHEAQINTCAFGPGASPLAGPLINAG